MFSAFLNKTFVLVYLCVPFNLVFFNRRSRIVLNGVWTSLFYLTTPLEHIDLFLSYHRLLVILTYFFKGNPLPPLVPKKGQILPMFFWKYYPSGLWNHLIAIQDSQLSGSNSPLKWKCQVPKSQMTTLEFHPINNY